MRTYVVGLDGSEHAQASLDWAQAVAGPEDAIVVAMLIFGGVLDACPDLKVCIAHGGGPACFAMGRLDRGWQSRADARGGAQQPPSTYQRRLYYDTILHAPAPLEFLVKTAGAAHVLLGSDYPFDMGTLECARQVKALAIPQADRATILGDAAAVLLRA